MSTCQPGILLPVPPHARYLTFSLKPGVSPRATLREFRDVADGQRVVAGIGASLALALGRNIEGLRAFPSHAGAGFDVPSTPSALWIWARGEDRGELFHRSRLIERTLARAFRLEQDVFKNHKLTASLNTITSRAGRGPGPRAALRGTNNSRRSPGG